MDPLPGLECLLSGLVRRDEETFDWLFEQTRDAKRQRERGIILSRFERDDGLTRHFQTFGEHRLSPSPLFAFRTDQVLHQALSVREELVQFAPCSALAYELEGGAGPFATARSRWSTLGRSDGTTELTVVGEFVPRGWIGYVMWPLSKPAVTGLTRRVIGELDSFIASA